MPEHDYSDVDPLRLPEARRRVEAIEEYLGIVSPTNADAIAFGRRLGLSRHQFYRLVRAWREHRKPGLLVIGRRGPATRDYGIDPAAAAITRDVIDEVGAAAELAEVAPEVERRCEVRGVTPPSRPTIWTWIRKGRAAGAIDVGGDPRLVVGRLWFHLPIEGEQTTNLPMALVGTLLPERRIVAHIVSVDESSPPSVAELVAAVVERTDPDAPARPLLMEADDRREASDALAVADLEATRPHTRSLQRELGRALGGRLGRLRALHRRSSARTNRDAGTERHAERATPEAAIRAVDAAVAEHNAALADGDTPFALRWR